MEKALIKIMDMVTKINRSMIWIIGTVIGIMTILLFIDVMLRYLFNSPTSWAFEIITWSTAIIAFTLGGYVLANDQHIRVDFFFEKFSPKTRAIIDLISFVFLFAIVIAFIWIGGKYVLQYYASGLRSGGGLNMPLWLQWTVVPIGGLLMGLQALVKLVNDIYIIARGKELYNSKDPKEAQ